MMSCRRKTEILIAAILAVLGLYPAVGFSQTVPAPTPSSISRYLDQANGMTDDDLVRLALENNGELVALRKEADSGEQLLRQAKLRANPSLEVSGARQIGGADNNVMIQAEQPLELGGRRAARALVAEKELEIRRQAAAERERQLAYEVRSKFGDVLAAAFKLRFTEEMLAAALENFNLVAAQVDEGRRPPLERNLEVVELNRIRAMREMDESNVELRMLELKNLIGADPEDPLRLRGDFDDITEAAIPPQELATSRALEMRPDLLGARAVEALAEARISQARSEGKIDADVMLGYQRMRSGFPLLGIEERTGALLPIDSKFHFFTFGVRLNLPVRNRNQGLIAAAQLERDAARSRRELGELTVKREIAAAYAMHHRALRAVEIFRVGVRDQARENLDVLRQTYEIGSKTLLDYIAELRRFIETENAFLDARLEAHHSHLEILRATNARELINK